MAEVYEVKIYDEINELVAILENAVNISYSLRVNELFTAQFSLPATDAKNSECIPFRRVEIFEEGERIELFRIIPYSLEKNQSGSLITYQCEHVIATLLDSILFQYHQTGGSATNTEAVIEYVLTYQNTELWQLGSCDFTRLFEYKFENENLLAAILAIPKPFNSPHIWTYDTNTTPWTLNLEELDITANPSSYIRYGKNLKGITKDVDSTQLCTRLYPLGYGEGINQLTIKSENSDIEYIDADTIDSYGVISRVWTDRRYESAETLKGAAESLLDGLKDPKITYSVDAAELYNITKRSGDKFEIGEIVKVIDEELDIDFSALILGKSKNNIDSDSWNCQLEISNKIVDIAGSISDLANRARINDTYAQGATNIYSESIAENADGTHPAILKFYIPSDTVRINKVEFAWTSSAFRAYSTGATEEAAKTPTTTEEAVRTPTTTEEAAKTPTTTEEAVRTPTTTEEPSTTPTSTEHPANTPWSSSANGSVNTEVESEDYFQYGSYIDSEYEDGTIGSHKHRISDIIFHKHNVIYGDHNHATTIAKHDHDVTIPKHDHDVTIPKHDHDVTIPAHDHDVTIPKHDHDVTIPAHDHNIVYGIYEGPTPSSLEIDVDGSTLDETTTSGSIDITSDLGVDGEGKITRGSWHTIEITPNTLGRITANINVQLFVQSRGGGDY